MCGTWGKKMVNVVLMGVCGLSSSNRRCEVGRGPKLLNEGGRIVTVISVVGGKSEKCYCKNFW